MEPSRFKPALIAKKIIFSVFARLPFLDRLNADVISGLSLICSLIFCLLIAKSTLIISSIALFFVLFLDALDGVVAQVKGHASSEEGWIVDVSVDRVSEAIISITLSRISVFLVIMNIGLSLYSYRSKKHMIIPLRQFLLSLLILSFIFNSQIITFLLDGLIFNW